MNARSSACMAIGGGCDGRFRSRQPADESVTETTKTKGTSRLSSEFKPVGKLGSEIGKIRV